MDQLEILKHEKGNVYLLPTKHNSRRSVGAVADALTRLKPHVVAIELCLSKLERYANTTRSNKSRDLDLIPPRLREKAFDEKIVLEMIKEALIHGRRGVKPKPSSEIDLQCASINLFRLQPKTVCFAEFGKEILAIFRKETWQLDFNEMKYLVSPRVDYKIMLAGKPIEKTLDGIADALTHDEINVIKVYIKNFTKLFVENSSAVSILSHILRRNRRLRNVLVRERHEYMANSLAKAIQDGSRKQNFVRVLAVVKDNHVNGIRKCWNEINGQFRK